MSSTRASFFRQSAWLAFATVAGGAFMTAVQTVASKLPTAQFEIFGAMLRLILLLGIPSAGLQIAFARQAAVSLTPETRAQLASTMRGVLGAIALLWLILVGVTVVEWDSLSAQFKLGSSWVLLPTLGVALFWSAVPVFRGVLQGVEDFGFLGGAGILDAFTRFVGVCLVVFLLRGGATGAMTAAFAGIVVSTSLAAWASRSMWTAPGAAVSWRSWLAQVLPLTLGASAMIVLASYDLVYLKAMIPAELAEHFQFGDRYLPASLIGYALTQVTVPLSMVMFPKIARSTALGARTDALALALIGTAALGLVAVGLAALFPRLPLQILFFNSPSKWAAAPLVPWCSLAMLVYALSNVLVSNLLAQRRFAIVPWAVGVAALFLWTLHILRARFLAEDPFAAFREIAQIICGFNFLLFLLAAAMTWGKTRIEAETNVAKDPIP